MRKLSSLCRRLTRLGKSYCVTRHMVGPRYQVYRYDTCFKFYDYVSGFTTVRGCEQFLRSLLNDEV